MKTSTKVRVTIGLTAIIAGIILLITTGCSSPKLENKALTIKGYSAVNLLRTGYDPATQTVTPSTTSIISSGMYSSVPTGTGSKDFLYYSSETSTSIFNSQSKDSQESLIFASSDKELIKTIVNAMAERLKTETATDSGQEAEAKAPTESVETPEVDTGAVDSGIAGQ